MQVRWKGAVLSAVVAGGLVGFSLLPQQANAAPQPMRFNDLTQTQKRLMSGFASAEVDQARGALAPKAATAASRRSTRPRAAPAGTSTSRAAAGGAATRIGSNVNMDTDCQNVSDPDLAGRGQAQNETYISEDHNRAGNLLGSSNDYRRGDGGCFGYYSLDNGRTFQDVAIPNSFTRGDALRSRAPVLGRRRRHLQRVRHARQRLLQLPGVQPRHAHEQQPRPVERPHRLPLDRQRRRLLHLPGAGRRPRSR